MVDVMSNGAGLGCDAMILPPDDGARYEVKHDRGMVFLRSGTRNYRVRVRPGEYIRHMKVNIKLTVGEDFHIDIVDLYSQKSRGAYIKRIEGELGVPGGEVQKDLYQIIEAVEASNLSGNEDPLEPKVVELTSKEKEDALVSLNNPQLLDEIKEDLEKLGCVGEWTNKLLGYCVAISRKIENPLSIIITSQSGTGKSTLADTLEDIIPPEDCIHLSRITPQALYYMPKNALTNKVLIIEEKEGSLAADYSLRVLQSKKRLRLLVPSKDPHSGVTKSRTVEVEGPTSIVETSTRQDINPENTSRCFVVYLDESEDQTRRIHESQRIRMTIDGKGMVSLCERLKVKHHNIQRMLKPIPVHIPYVDKISFPTRWVRARRDYLKLLNLIEAVSFLHQYQRRRIQDDQGQDYIEANLDDYRISYSLACHLLGEAHSELKAPERDFYELIKGMVKASAVQTFTRRKIREYTNLPDHLVRRYLKTLVDYEYLLVTRGRNGVKFEYTLNETAQSRQEMIQGLTTPEDLAATLQEGLTHDKSST